MKFEELSKLKKIKVYIDFFDKWIWFKLEKQLTVAPIDIVIGHNFKCTGSYQGYEIEFRITNQEDLDKWEVERPPAKKN